MAQGSTPEQRRAAYLWGAVAVAAFALRPLWLVVAPYVGRCRFRALTGLPCPTCGTTHAAVALLEGRLLDALAANPLATVAGLVLLGGGPLAVVWAVSRAPAPRIPATLRRSLLWLLALLVLANWAYLGASS